MRHSDVKGIFSSLFGYRTFENPNRLPLDISLIQLT